MDYFRLDNKIAVVIGGGGGIGGSIARGLAQYGAKVVVADLNYETANKVAEDINVNNALNAVAIKVDVTSEENIIELKNKVLSSFNTIDILVNAQGIHRYNTAVNFSPDTWELVFNVNARSIMFTCREFGQIMLKNNCGKIINISSIRGIRTTPWEGNTIYNASKSTVDMITRSLAVEWAKNNINVNAIAPSHVTTSKDMSPSLSNAEKLKNILTFTPMGRVAQPEEIIGACIFLASPASNYITGQVIYLDGGMMALGS
jgi:NAD(P)-dependent dehydrogenase (short-subunit alcohol dehydrogenase family)